MLEKDLLKIYLNYILGNHLVFQKVFYVEIKMYLFFRMSIYECSGLVC